MKRGALLAATGFAALFALHAHAACTPATGQASFFVDANFSGNCVTLPVGNYPDSNHIGLPNDSISSIRIGPGAQAEICQDDNYGGRCQTVTGDIVDMSSSHPVGNDQISSLKVQSLGAPPNCPPGAGQASFFIAANFTGGCVTLGINEYANAAAIGLPNDSISSIRIGPGAQADICPDDFFAGQCQTVTGDIADMSTSHPVGNDQISSLRVQPLGTPTNCPPGRNQASFFVDTNFASDCVTLNIAEYPNSAAIGLPNDSISSIRIGLGAQARICQDEGFGGQCQTVTGDIADMSTSHPVGNDQISSLKVQTLGVANNCPPGPNQASFFIDTNFANECVALNMAEYPNAAAIGLPNDSISSIRIGLGAQARICQDENFGGQCQTVASDIADMSTSHPVGNDQISSLKVQTLGAANNCAPGPNLASFFIDANFANECVALNIAGYPNAAAIGLPNDSISSIRVGTEAQAIICQDENYGGQCQTVTANIADMRASHPVGNDQISSLKVQQRGTPTNCPPGPNQASFFVDANFANGCVTLNIADYPNAAAIGLPNDSISSIRIGPGAQAQICRDENFSGQCQTVTSDIVNLGASHPVGNDEISSLRVQPLGSPPSCAPSLSQASFFVDDNFSGPCVTLSFGDYPTAMLFGLPNDSVSSIKMGAQAQAFVCQDDHFGGQCQLVTGDLASLSNQAIGDNQISSVNVRPRGAPLTCEPGPTQAALYVDDKFSNACTVLNVGRYPTPAVFQLPDNSVSSIRVGAQVQVLACRDAQFGGICQTIGSDLPTLVNQPVGNDTISSVMVTLRGSVAPCTVGSN